MINRRFVTLIEQWIYEIEIDKTELSNVLLNLLASTQDFATQYTIISCLSKMVKNDHLQSLDYGNIVKQCVPVAVSLFSNLKNPSFVWGVSQFLGNMLQNCGDNVTPTLMEGLAGLQIEKLVNQNPNLMKSVFSKLLTHLLIWSNDPRFAYELSWRFLQCGMITLDDVQADTLAQFWLFFLRLIEPNRSKEDQFMLSKLFELANQNFKTLWRFHGNESVRSRLYELIEELVLAGYPFPDLWRFLTNQYSELKPEEPKKLTVCLRLKIDLFSIFMSLLLQGQMQNSLESLPVDQILEMATIEMFADYSALKDPKNAKTLKKQANSLFCRLLLVNASQVLTFVGSKGVSMDQFFNTLNTNMGIAKSKSLRRLNALALLQLAQNLNQEQMFQYFEIFVQHLLPEVGQFIRDKMGGANGTQVGLKSNL